MIINTRRTAQEQEQAVSSGHSWVAHSKHEDGLAIDICPYEMYAVSGENKLDWNTSDPIWWKIGEIGESIGLRWGGRFSAVDKTKMGKDPGHFELQG